MIQRENDIFLGTKDSVHLSTIDDVDEDPNKLKYRLKKRAFMNEKDIEKAEEEKRRASGGKKKSSKKKVKKSTSP